MPDMLIGLTDSETMGEARVAYWKKELEKAEWELDKCTRLVNEAIADGLNRNTSEAMKNRWRRWDESKVKVNVIKTNLDPWEEELRALRNVANLTMVEIYDNGCGWTGEDELILGRKIKRWFSRNTCFYGNKTRIYRYDEDADDDYRKVTAWVYDGSEKWIKGVLSSYKCVDVLAAEKRERMRQKAIVAKKKAFNDERQFIKKWERRGDDDDIRCGGMIL